MSGIHQLLVLLMTSCVVVFVSGHSYIRRLMSDRRSYVGRHHSVFKRSTLDDSTSAIIETLNSLRRQRPGTANMHYVSWDDELASVATNLVRTCELRTNARSLGPRPNTYNYDGITGYLELSFHDISDQLRDAYNKPQFRRQLQTVNMRFTGCAVSSHECIVFSRQHGLVNAQLFVCLFAYNRSSNRLLKSGVVCSRCETDAVWCDDGLCRDVAHHSHTEDSSCLSLCADCQTVTSSDNCQCICYYGDSTARCGRHANASDPTCRSRPVSRSALSTLWVALIVSLVGALVLVVIVVASIRYLVRRYRRRRVQPSRQPSSTDNEYVPGGAYFVPTMTPPPYDADQPPAYATAAAIDLGETDTYKTASSDVSAKSPAYDNSTFTTDDSHQ